jgi:hypothetical protein
MAGKVAKLEALLESAGGEQERRTLANLVMSGGARPPARQRPTASP